MNLKDKIEAFLGNEELILDIKTSLVIIVAVFLPMLYFLYSKNFSLGGLLAAQFGVLSLFVIAGNVSVFMEISDKAIRDEKKVNTDVTDEEKRTVEAQETLPNDVDTIIVYNKVYNEEKQHNRNLMRTNKEITRLENKITSRKIKGKSYTKLEQRIEHLRENPLYDKSYKPVQLKYIIRQEKVSDNEIEGNDAIYVNPQTYGMRRFLVKQVFKALSIGSSGMFIIAISDDGWTILTFFAIYIFSLALLCVFRYPKVRKITRTLYPKSLKNKQAYIKGYHEWFAKGFDFEIDFSAPFDFVPKEKALSM